MSEEYWGGRIDPLLLPFLSAPDEREEQRTLDQLIAAAAPGIAAITRYSRTPEDAFQETTYRLVKQLRQLRDQGASGAIGNYLHYVQVVASRVVKGQVRQEHPMRRSLADSLRHLLKTDASLAAWDYDGRKLCGIAAWRDQRPERTDSERLTRLLHEPLACSGVLPCDAAMLNQSALLNRVFHWVGHPFRFDQLVSIICALKRIEDRSSVAGGQVGGRAFSEWLADTRRLPDEELQWRQFLGRLWAEIEQLPRLHRLAYLLNFTAADGQLELFWVYGIASIRRIGAALRIADDEFARVQPDAWHAGYDERFAALWQQLPLSDAAIAALIGTERQKVINLRKAAGDRLSRLMIRAEASSHLNRCASGMGPSKQKPVRRKNGVVRPSFNGIAGRLSAAAAHAGAIAGS
jgi:hypothetical protein